MRILLVEDNPGDARLFEETLRDTDLRGCTLDWQRNFGDGWIAATEHPYDVVFLDLGLPDLDGLGALEGFRKGVPALPIVVLTGRNDGSLSLEALKSGAQDYLLKDRLNPDHLDHAIRFAIQRKQAEEALGKQERDQRQALKLEAIGQLAAGIAHEINTPMQYVGDNLTFLRDNFEKMRSLLERIEKLAAAESQAADAPQLAELGRLAQAVDLGYLLEEFPSALAQSIDGVARVTTIVRAMKDFSHPGAEEKRFSDVGRMIESTLLVCRSEWKYVAVVNTDIALDLPSLHCYPSDLNQVFLNIIVNASHAIAERNGPDAAALGSIRIAAYVEDETMRIRISDNGSGIPEAIRSKIFEPFFTTKEVGKGTGQGLAVSYDVVVLKHGGTIDVESEVGVGTSFVLGLPLGPDVSDDTHGAIESGV